MNEWANLNLFDLSAVQSFDITNDLVGVLCQPSRMASSSIRLRTNGVGVQRSLKNPFVLSQIHPFALSLSKGGFIKDRSSRVPRIARCIEGLPSFKCI